MKGKNENNRTSIMVLPWKLKRRFYLFSSHPKLLALSIFRCGLMEGMTFSYTHFHTDIKTPAV